MAVGAGALLDVDGDDADRGERGDDDRARDVSADGRRPVAERDLPRMPPARSSRSRPGTPAAPASSIDSDGHVVTNEHVVGTAQTVEVRFAEGGEEQARVVATDRSTDLAVLEVDLAGHEVTPVELGSSADVEVGDSVYAIGNPFGLERSLTAGIVSAVDRDIEAPNGFTINDAIQTDAPVNQGNSGGPLLDADGQRDRRRLPDRERDRRQRRHRLRRPERHRPRRSSTRCSATARSSAATSASGSPRPTTASGSPTCSRASPPTTAGLQSGDVVLEAAGKPVESAADIQDAVSARKPGEKLELKIRRGERRADRDGHARHRPPAAE